MTQNQTTEGCTQLVWRVTHDGSRWGVQAWDKLAPAEDQSDALNRVLPDTRHFVSREPCGRRPAFGLPICAHHGRLVDAQGQDDV